MAFIKEADKHEERAGGDAVSEHLIDSAVEAPLIAGEHAENDKAQMADGTVGH